MDFSILSQPESWIALGLLSFLEIILGIDNVIFISIVSGKLPEKQQPKAQKIGLLLALIFRIMLLFSITWLFSLKRSLFGAINFLGLSVDFSFYSLIIIAGGLFLIYKSVTEIHLKLEGSTDEQSTKKTHTESRILSVVIQIALIDLVFSFDSILTALGVVNLNPPPTGFGRTGGLTLMVIAVCLSILVMLLFTNRISSFINKHPSLQMLALSFLILIGFLLLTEGAHIAQMSFMKQEIHPIPKAYLYVAIGFALLVEFLNIRYRKKNN